MLGLISNHFKSSLLAAGKYTPYLTQLKLNEVIEDAIFHHTLTALESQIEIVYQENCRPQVQIDRSSVQDVVSQLLGHAIQIAKPSSLLRIKLFESNKQAKILIKVETDNLDFNLNPKGWKHAYVSVSHKALEADFESSFPTLKQIIEHNDGSLWISPQQLEKGFSFFIEFPVAA